MKGRCGGDGWAGLVVAGRRVGGGQVLRWWTGMVVVTYQRRSSRGCERGARSEALRDAPQEGCDE